MWRVIAVLAGLLGPAAVTPVWGSTDSAEPWKAPVTVETPRGEPVPARLTAVDLATGELIRSDDWQIEAPWQGSIELPISSGWRLSAEAEGFWAASRAVIGDGQSSTLRFLPTSNVAGRLQLPRGETAPESVTVRFNATPGPRGDVDPDLPETSFACPVTEARWVCNLPAGVLDLRIEATGFTPHYVWNITLQPRKSMDLGEFRLERGASIAGWIEAPGSASESGTAVEIEPRNSGWLGDPGARRRIGSLTRKTEANNRGFFQLRAVAPGGYVLTARQNGLPPVEVYPIDVEAGAELVLEAVVLHQAADLLLIVEPPVDPRGSSWVIGVQRQRAMTSALDRPEEAVADANGSWEKQGLTPGEYWLSISDARGSTWVRERIELEPGSNQLPIEVPLVRIVGRLIRGDEPLPGELVFGSTQGLKQIQVSADEDGEFEGYLPHEGLWPVELALTDKGFGADVQALDPVEVKVAPGQKVARLEIELPDTRLAGQVFEDDLPTEANLTMVRTGEDKRREARLRTDEDGEFELLGLSPGQIIVKASTAEKSTDWVAVEILEGVETPRLELVIEEKTILAGQVRFGGTPYPGARIIAYPDSGSSIASTTQAISEADGFFELKVPARATSAEMIVIPPGFDIQLFRIPLSKQPPPLVIDLENSGATLSLRSGGSSLAEISKGNLVHRAASLNIRLLKSQLYVAQRWVVAEGQLSFHGMEPGEYQLCTSTAGCHSVYLNPNAEAVLKVPAARSQKQNHEGDSTR